MTEIKIGGRTISTSSEPFIVLEAGINHNGELERAYEMIRVAKSVGADVIKFQTFKAEEFVADHGQMFTYTSQGEEATESMLQMFKRYEFSAENWRLIKKRCDKEGIVFMSTPQNRSDLDLLLSLGIPAIKVGSDDFINIPLLKSYAETRLPLILSCGMSDLAEVHQALEAVGALQGYPTILLLCTSLYPTPSQDVNVSRLKTLRSAFPNLILGFSDHTIGSLAASLAVALGATVFEKHFTLDHNLPGPDHWFSEDQAGIKTWISSIETAFTMLGDGVVRPSEEERKNKKEFQRVIVAANDITQGEIFTAENLTMRRVAGGKGFPPRFFDAIKGKPALRNYRKGEAVMI